MKYKLTVIFFRYSRKERRFLVIDVIQLILVEPDTRRLGWGVVKFVGFLQVSEDRNLAGDQNPKGHNLKLNVWWFTEKLYKRILHYNLIKLFEDLSNLASVGLYRACGINFRRPRNPPIH